MKFPLYNIIYEQGITQQKYLIPHKEYVDVIKPARKVIDTFKSEKELKNKTFTKDQFSEAEYIIKGYPELWFTDNSPIYDAITTGLLSLLPTQGGDHIVSVKLVD